MFLNIKICGSLRQCSTTRGHWRNAKQKSAASTYASDGARRFDLKPCVVQNKTCRHALVLPTAWRCRTPHARSCKMFFDYIFNYVLLPESSLTRHVFLFVECNFFGYSQTSHSTMKLVLYYSNTWLVLYFGRSRSDLDRIVMIVLCALSMTFKI